MGLDIRVPIGLLFTVMGVLLAGFGLATNHSLLYEASLGVNINLVWGLAMLAMGMVLLWLGRRRTSAERPASAHPPEAPIRRGHSGAGH